MEHPRVFVSHASKDNERFVIDFATKLRAEQGVDAFVDAWEIRPGDSLKPFGRFVEYQTLKMFIEFVDKPLVFRPAPLSSFGDASARPAAYRRAAKNPL